jgi:hypothetical protein
MYCCPLQVACCFRYHAETLCVSYQGEAGFCLACLDMATLSRAIITVLLSQDLTKAKEQADC